MISADRLCDHADGHLDIGVSGTNRHRHVGVLFVQRKPLTINIVQRFVGMKDNAARGDVRHAALDLLKGHVDKDDRPHRREMRHRLVAEHHGAAGGDDRVLAFQRAADLFLQYEKLFEPVFVKDRLQGLARPAADDQIGVDEGKAQCFGKQHAERAFSGAGHSD